MAQAHALLNNIQAEILESQRAVGHLRAQAEALPAAQAAQRARAGELVTKMGRRFRLGWEKWVKDEEQREQEVRGRAGGALVPAPAPPVADDEMRGGAPGGEDVADLQRLYEDVPGDAEGLRQACEALRADIVQHRKRRKETFETLVTFQAEAGTSGRMGEYRRLIGAGCGGVPPSEVDHVLGMLLETLESEEPSSSSTAWSGPRSAMVA
ncbi:hypothetical protein HWV62_871 [Athelia sp. TMB]|nr:hypothetical protein HWV62_871 [Athelia sp. TMB]